MAPENPRHPPLRPAVRQVRGVMAEKPWDLLHTAGLFAVCEMAGIRSGELVL